MRFFEKAVMFESDTLFASNGFNCYGGCSLGVG